MSQVKNRPTEIVGLETLGPQSPPAAQPQPPQSLPQSTMTNATSTGTIKLTPNLNRSFLTPVTGGGHGESGGGGGLGIGGSGGSGMEAIASDRLSKLFWQSKHTTIAYCFVFWGFGMCVAFLGPTLLDLGCKTGSVLSTMSWIFFAQSLFILIGSATGGFVIQRLSVNMVLFISTVMLSVTLAIIPFCNVLGVLALVLAVMGYFMGTIDTVANVSMIALYGKSVAPFLQALHFFYGFGAFVSPMIAEPFLLNKDCSSMVDHTSVPVTIRGVINHHHPATNDSHSNTTIETLEEAQKLIKIDYAFWIMALLQIPVIAIVFTLLMKQLYVAFTENSNESHKQMMKPKEQYENVEMGVTTENGKSVLLKDDDDDHPPATQTQIVTITLLTSLLLFLYDGLQATYGGYIYYYAKNNVLDMTPSEAAYLNAYFWGTFAFGRLISIIVATKFSPMFMLFCNIVGCMSSMLLMLAMSHNRTALYLGTCCFGLFLSSVYPTAVSLAEQFISVTSIVTSCVVVGAASGEMLLPVIVGHEIEASPINFLITGFCVTLFSVFVYGAIWVVGGSIIRQQATPGFLGALLSVVTVQPDNGEDTGLVSRHVKYYSRMRHTSESSAGGDPEEAYGESIEINREEFGRQ